MRILRTQNRFQILYSVLVFKQTKKGIIKAVLQKKSPLGEKIRKIFSLLDSGRKAKEVLEEQVYILPILKGNSFGDMPGRQVLQCESPALYLTNRELICKQKETQERECAWWINRQKWKAEKQKDRTNVVKIKSMKQKRKEQQGLPIKGFRKSEARGFSHLESSKGQNIVLRIAQRP